METKMILQVGKAWLKAAGKVSVGAMVTALAGAYLVRPGAKEFSEKTTQVINLTKNSIKGN